MVENKQKTIIEKFISDVTCGATEKSQILKSQQKSVLSLMDAINLHKLIGVAKSQDLRI